MLKRVNEVRHLICAVPQCSSEMAKNPEKKFISVPLQAAINKKWRTTLGIPDSVSSAIICEDHLLINADFEVDVMSKNTTSPLTNINSKRPIGQRFFTRVKKRQKKTALQEEESTDNGAMDEFVSAVENNCEDKYSSSSCVYSEESNDPICSSNGLKNHDYDSDNSCSLTIKLEPEDIETYDPSGPEMDHKYFATRKCEVTTLEKMRIPINELNKGSPHLVIIDQPEPSYRFRYKRESSRPHGPMKGRSFSCNSWKDSKGPKVKLCNFRGKEAVIRVWLYCSEGPSPHQLVSTNGHRSRMRDNNIAMEPHEIIVDETTEYTCSFDRLNILHVVCSDVDYQQQYYHKKVFSSSNSYVYPSNPPPFDIDKIKEEIKRKEKDIACLFFEAFEKTDHGYRKLCHIFTEDIKNKKSPKTNDLRIMKQSHDCGSCRGNQLVLIFTERIIKDVFIEFFEEDEDGEITWSSKGSFRDTDIHKQVAICFWTPPYKDLHIDKPVSVFFRLVRSTDGAFSNYRTYRYLPANCPCNYNSVLDTSSEAPELDREPGCRTPEPVEKVDQMIQCNLYKFSYAKNDCGSLSTKPKLVSITDFHKFKIQPSTVTKTPKASVQ